MFERFRPNSAVTNTVKEFGLDSRGFTAEQLLEKTKFWRLKWNWIPWISRMAGITLLPSFILITDQVLHSYKEKSTHRRTLFPVSSVVYHELIHVSQMLDDHVIIFLAKYVWQWIRSGFSYERMKSRGYEKEAYNAQDEFDKHR